MLNNLNLPIHYDIRYLSQNKKSPLIIVIHGFKGFKDWGFSPVLCQKYAENGFITISFDFSLNGIQEKITPLYDVEKFAQNTVTQELEDIDLLIRSIQNNTLFEKYINEINWNGEIYLNGFSLGGAISILTASKNNSINKIATWGSISRLDRYTKHQKDVWKKQGFTEFMNQQTGQKLRMNVSYLEDIEKHLEEYNLPLAVSNLNIPYLLIHGKQDLTVKLSEANELIIKGNKDTFEYEIIDKAGHTFGIVHPYFATHSSFEKATKRTIDFFLSKN